MNSDVIGNIALYHTVNDGLLNTTSTGSTGIPIIQWCGSCVLTTYSGKYFTFTNIGMAVDCRVQGMLISNTEINSNSIGGTLIIDTSATFIFQGVNARRLG